jgi:WD40 repeat protein
VAFSPDGSRVAYGTFDGTAALVSVASRHVISTYPGQTAPISQVAFSPDGRLVMTGSVDGTVRAWRGQGLALRSATPNGYPWIVVPLAAGFASVQVTSGGVTAQLWSGGLRPDAPPLTLWANASPVHLLVSQLVPLAGVSTGSALQRGRIVIWNVVKRRVINRVSATAPGLGSAISPAGRSIATSVPAGSNWAIALLDLSTGKFRTLARTNCSTPPGSFAFSRDGRLVAAAGSCGQADVWNVASGRRVGRPVMVGRGTPISGLAFSPDGRQLALPATDDEVTVINALTGAPLAILTDHTRGVTWAAYSPDGRYLATTSSDDTADIYDAHTFRLLRAIHDPAAVQGAVFTPDSQDLLTWDSNNVIAEWDACTDCQNPRALLALAASRVTRQLTPTERRTFGVD